MKIQKNEIVEAAAFKARCWVRLWVWVGSVARFESGFGSGLATGLAAGLGLSSGLDPTVKCLLSPHNFATAIKPTRAKIRARPLQVGLP